MPDSLLGLLEQAARATAMAAANRRCFIGWLTGLLIRSLSLALDAGFQVAPLVFNKVVAADVGAGSNPVLSQAHTDSAIRQCADLLAHDSDSALNSAIISSKTGPKLS